MISVDMWLLSVHDKCRHVTVESNIDMFNIQFYNYLAIDMSLQLLFTVAILLMCVISATGAPTSAPSNLPNLPTTLPTAGPTPRPSWHEEPKNHEPKWKAPKGPKKIWKASTSLPTTGPTSLPIWHEEPKNHEPKWKAPKEPKKISKAPKEPKHKHKGGH